MLNRKADIGAAKNTVFQRLANDDPRIMKELVVLARSPEVPENALALRKDIDVSVRNRLKESLLTMHLDPDGKQVLERFGALKFIETTDKDYDVVREIRGRHPPGPGHLRLQERLMKRKIVIGLAVYSVVFSCWPACTSSAPSAPPRPSLDRLITLHQVEILREHYLLQIKKVQADLTLMDTPYSRSFDTVVKNVMNMGRIIDTCFDCHHSPRGTERLNGAEAADGQRTRTP